MPLRNSYDRIANQWHQIRQDRHINATIIQFVQNIALGGHILDIGCGTGVPIAKYFSDMGFSVYGIDASEGMIDIARQNRITNASFVYGDFLDCEVEGQFDGIIAWDALFHFPLDQQSAIYPKVSNLLRSGGSFLFTHGLRRGQHFDSMLNVPFYYSSLDQSEVIQLLQEQAMDIEISIEYFDDGVDTRDWVVLARKR